MKTITFDVNCAEWNPDLENMCYRIENGPLHMEIEEGLGDVYFIEIDQ